jgi:hypothetical protein
MNFDAPGTFIDEGQRGDDHEKYEQFDCVDLPPIVDISENLGNRENRSHCRAQLHHRARRHTHKTTTLFRAEKELMVELWLLFDINDVYSGVRRDSLDLPALGQIECRQSETHCQRRSQHESRDRVQLE